jgi:hypothetical protein
VWWSVSDEGSTVSALLSSADDADRRCLSRFWSPSAFWVPSFTPKGFPLFCVDSVSLGVSYANALAAGGVDTYLVTDFDDLFVHLFRRVCVFVVPDPLSSSFYTFCGDFVDEVSVQWCCAPYDIGDSHADAFAKFKASLVIRTEDMWGELGAWPWRDLEVLLRQLDRTRHPVDGVCWERMWRCLDSGEPAKALMWGDQLWERHRRFKQRNYFDICSLYHTVHSVWAKQGAGDLFRDVAEAVLYDCVSARMPYERMLFTCFWLWTTQYWTSLCDYALRTGILHATNAQWTMICKETTAMVTQTWMFPLTNRQHISAAFFLNAEDLNGFSDADALKGEISVEVLKYALNEFKYTFPGANHGERSFEHYLEQMERACTSLLEPIYATYADKAHTWDEFVALRSAWAAGGVAGRRSRDVLGSDVSPPGAAKAYVMTMTEKDVWAMDWGKLYIEVAGKLDERGVDRTLSATDMRDQTSEGFVFDVLRNRYPAVGLDIGESPPETMARHINLVVASRGASHYLADGRILVAWDWSKWDHFVHMAEWLVVLKAMRKLVLRYVRLEVQPDMLRELDMLEAGHREAVFRSQAYADQHYSRVVDEIVKSAAGRARRLDSTSVLVTDPAGQQSGRRSTLESNTIVGTSRLLVRDAELLGCSANLRSRTSLYVLNRADDVAEVFAKYEQGKRAVEKMLEQGHLANPKKQVAQWRSIVYFRILYAGGTMRAFPPRAVYAACSGGPNKGSGSESSGIDKLRSLATGLEMWARKGGWYGMARALYDEAERFFSKMRVWTRECHLNPKKRPDVVRIAPEVLHAAPEMGGVGILPVGQYEYDYTVKVGRGKYELDAKYWRQKAEDYSVNARGPGIYDLEGRAKAWVKRSTGIEASGQDAVDFARKWSSGRSRQDGTGVVTTWMRNAAVCDAVRAWHRDESASQHHAAWESWPIMASLLRFNQAAARAERAVGGKEVIETMRDIRGPPAYGMFKSQYYGYADVIYRNSGKDPGVLRELAGGSALGRDYLAEAGALPDWLKELHLEGKLGAAGAWHKLLPASWAGWLDSTVAKALFETCKAVPSVRSSRHQLLLCRARLTSFAVNAFRHAWPQLFLH